jgi:hypothetical protein
MKKLVELIVKLDDIELDGAGVDAIALVENPAIELDFLHFNETAEWYVDNTGMEDFKKFLDDHQDIMKKPGGSPAGEGGVDHGAQMKLLEEQGIDTEYPFGYCFQIAQFMFYALGGYKSEWDLMCIKGMEYKVAGHDFASTHWYVQNKETGRIIDLSSEQFDDILDIEEYYSEGRRANLGFPYYNVEGEKVEFEETVPSLMTLKLYNVWKEEGNGELEGIEPYYQACKYEETRMSMQFNEAELPWTDEEFVAPLPGEAKDEFIGRCMSVVTGEGKDQDQALAICYSYWEEGFDAVVQAPPYVDQCGDRNCETHKYGSVEKFTEEQKWIYEQCQNMGEEYDPHTAIIVDVREGKFDELGNTLDAIKALDVLGNLVGEQGEDVYRYAGPLPQRGFCRAMMVLNKVYRPNEVALLDVANPGFGANGASTYSVLKYKGGPNCRHYWEHLTMFNRGGRKVFVSHGPVNADTPGGVGITGADKVAAGQSNNRRSQSPAGSVPNNAYLMSKMHFAVDEEQRIVIGPAMVANKKILRRDELGNPYYVYFKPETIRQIAEKVFQEGKHNMTNEEHQSDKTHTRNTLLESWIVEDPEMDKAKALGFDVPKDTWMVSYKINDDKMWEDVKSGKLRGFSVEGYFIEKAEALRAAEQTYSYIMNILGQING